MPDGELLYPSPQHQPAKLQQQPHPAIITTATSELLEDETWVWSQIKEEARRDAESEPALASYFYSTILSHFSLERSLSFHLVRARDPACVSYSHCLLNYKGFLACQAHRIAHKLWIESRETTVIGNNVSILHHVTLGGNRVAIGTGRFLVGKKKPSRHEDVPGESMDHTSFISEWSDYAYLCISAVCTATYISCKWTRQIMGRE
ncbi:hypothetical protein MKX03_018664 [Papaver bracteatum]|nr:hypothetical protein MKX03_018664 [Papaver bracteatum]